MDVRLDLPADGTPLPLPLLDLSGLALPDLVRSEDSALIRAIRERLDDLDDDRNPVLSAFGSFVSS